MTTTAAKPKDSDRALKLDHSEKRRLDELEGIIERGLETFLEVGQALMEIRDSKLYRETHRRFGDYVRVRYGMTRQRAHQLIDAARLSTIVDTRSSERRRRYASAKSPRARRRSRCSFPRGAGGVPQAPRCR